LRDLTYLASAHGGDRPGCEVLRQPRPARAGDVADDRHGCLESMIALARFWVFGLALPGSVRVAAGSTQSAATGSWARRGTPTSARTRPTWRSTKRWPRARSMTSRCRRRTSTASGWTTTMDDRAAARRRGPDHRLVETGRTPRPAFPDPDCLVRPGRDGRGAVRPVAVVRPAPDWQPAGAHGFASAGPEHQRRRPPPAGCESTPPRAS
jgi:hypothetical protein